MLLLDYFYFFINFNLCFFLFFIRLLLQIIYHFILLNYSLLYYLIVYYVYFIFLVFFNFTRCRLFLFHISFYLNFIILYNHGFLSGTFYSIKINLRFWCYISVWLCWAILLIRYVFNRFLCLFRQSIRLVFRRSWRCVSIKWFAFLGHVWNVWMLLWNWL